MDQFNYSSMVDNAMRGVVRDIMRNVQSNGLNGQHHFFISFRTDHPNAQVPPSLLSKYPHEITIVLQHQFWDLFVAQDHFKVSLSFNNVPEKLVIPFAALTGFADPSTKFGLQFHSEPVEVKQDNGALPSAPVSVAAASVEVKVDEAKESAQIFALDTFRKK